MVFNKFLGSCMHTAVESRKQDGQLSACEVTLVHYEDMGIPKDVAKVGVRHGMWGAVKKLQSGMRAYQLMRRTENTLSRSALMARITTKIPAVGSYSLLDQEQCTDGTEEESGAEDDSEAKKAERHGIDWKWVVIGGTVAAVCVHTGIIGKVLLVGGAAAQRMGRKK